jgi:hypothetical protein
MPMTVPLLAVLLAVAFYLGLMLGAAITLWYLPRRLANQPGELESLAIRTLQHKQAQYERLRDRQGRHLRAAGEREPPS